MPFYTCSSNSLIVKKDVADKESGNLNTRFQKFSTQCFQQKHCIDFVFLSYSPIPTKISFYTPAFQMFPYFSAFDIFGVAVVNKIHCTLLRTGTLTLLKQLNVAALESDVVAYGALVIEVICGEVTQLLVFCLFQMSYGQLQQKNVSKKDS